MSSNDKTADFGENLWIDYGDYWLFNASQRSQLWLNGRKGRLTGSVTGGAIGHSNFTTPEIAALEISGKKEKQFTPKQLTAMEHGTKTEPIACQWYEKNKGVVVKDLGMVIPKWNPYIGVSVDGVVFNQPTASLSPVDGIGIIEIKCPQRMYNPLYAYDNGERLDIPNSITKGFDHIWKSHYDQMMMGMAVLKMPWCDYIVYCTSENKVFTQRIPWNQDYWTRELYPKTINFIETKLKPLLIDTDYPIMPPK